jgi:hypothetical protein
MSDVILNPDIEAEQTQASEVEVNDNADVDQSKVEIENTEKTEDVLPKGVLKRFKTLTDRNKQYESQIAELSYKLENLNKKPVDLSELTDEQIIDYRVKEALNKQNQYQQEQMKQQEMANKRKESVTAQVNSYKSFVPDIESVLEDSQELILPNNAIDFIRSSEVGIMLAYYAQKDETIYEKIQSLSSNEKALERYLTKLEMKIEDEIELKSKSVKDKPAKTPPVGNISSTNPGSAKDPSKMSMAEYKIWRTTH